MTSLAAHAYAPQIVAGILVLVVLLVVWLDTERLCDETSVESIQVVEAPKISATVVPQTSSAYRQSQTAVVVTFQKRKI